MSSPRILINMMTLLGRNVLIKEDDGSFREDCSWHEHTKRVYDSLFRYLHARSLLSSDLDLTNLEAIVLTEADLTSAGLSLWKSGAVYRWLGSFDRSPTKELTNYDILDVALGKARSSNSIGRR